MPPPPGKRHSIPRIFSANTDPLLKGRAQCQVRGQPYPFSFVEMWRQTLSLGILTLANIVFGQQISTSSCPATYFQLSDSPYENYFVSTCNFAATVVALSPDPDSNLTLISPRLIAAFPAGRLLNFRSKW